MEDQINNAVFKIVDSAALTIIAESSTREIIADYVAIAAAISTIIIAVVALYFTFRQSRVQNDQMSVQRKHNKISVKPFLYGNYVSETRTSDAEFQIILSNGGLGPAFIDEFTVLLYGEPCEFEKEFELLRESVNGQMSHVFLNKGDAIPPNAEDELLLIKYRIKSGEDEKDFEKRANAFEKKANAFNWRIKYSSMYDDEKWTYESEKEKKAHSAI